MRASRREILAGIATAGLLPAPALGQAVDSITPEAFGAKGDGRTNDTDAFAAMSAFVNARGGGTIVLRRTTYIVGKQARIRAANANFSFAPSDIIHLVGCSRPVVIRGNGAILRAAAGLRYGGYDPQSGAAVDDHSVIPTRHFRASPYSAMVNIEHCTGSIDISDLELDGGLRGLRIGGKSARGRWQGFGGTGLRLIANSGPERVARLNCHRHPQDGMIITGLPGRSASSSIVDVTCDYNARQGCSLTGGRNYTFERCRFRHTGKAGLSVPPGAGVDIEAEQTTIRDVLFSDCEFSDNSGAGVVAGSGDSAGVTFVNCRLIGTTNWAAWPDKPRMRFDTCLFVGAIVHAYGSRDAGEAAQFLNCTFRDDPALSPTGEVYGGGHIAHPIAVLPDNPNVLFSRCNFALTHVLALPISANVIYADCNMSQRSAARSRPRGTYLGTSRIDGNADLTGSNIRGVVILNGRRLAGVN